MAVLTATNGNVQLTAGELVDTPAAAFTVAVLFYRAGTTTDGFETLAALVTAGNQIITNVGADAGAEPYQVSLAQGGQTRTFGFDDLNDNEAYLFVVVKGNGTVTPRANLYRFDAGVPGWDGWADGNDTSENRADVIDRAWLLNQPGGFPWNGGVYVCAWWNAALDEADVTDPSAGLHIGVQQWLSVGGLEPVALWRPGENDPIVDESPSRTSDEISRSNVTIVDQDPTNFNMDFGGGAVTGVLAAELPAATAALAGDVEVSGDVTATLPAAVADLTGDVTASGELAATLPAATVALTGTVTVTGALDAALPAVIADLTGDLTATGTLDVALPTVGAELDGVLTLVGELDETLPSAVADFTGNVTQDVTGELEVQLPSFTAALTGTSAAVPPIPGVDLMTLAFTIVTGVGQCVVDELEDTLGGVPDRVCLIVPGDIAWDDCQCGLFAQTITTEVPSENFPFPATDRRTTACGPAFLVVNAVASITRCAPTFDRNNRPPTCDQLMRAALILEQDRHALRRGVTCCLRDRRNSYGPDRITDFTVGTATSVGPDGMCVGVELTYQFAISNICC